MIKEIPRDHAASRARAPCPACGRRVPAITPRPGPRAARPSPRTALTVTTHH